MSVALIIKLLKWLTYYRNNIVCNLTNTEMIKANLNESQQVNKL